VTSAPASVPVRPHADVSNVGIPPTADIAFIDVGPEMVPMWVCWVFFAFLNVEPGSISLHIWCTCLARKVPYPLCLLGGGGESTCKRGSVRDQRVGPWMTIHLCGRPGSVHGRTALSLRDLAPGGVCRATPVARGAGALLPHRFTLTGRNRRSVLCGTFLRVTSTGASQHPVLRSPDFPQPRRAAVIQSAPRHHQLVCHAYHPSPPRPRQWWLQGAG